MKKSGKQIIMLIVAGLYLLMALRYLNDTKKHCPLNENDKNFNQVAYVVTLVMLIGIAIQIVMLIKSGKSM